MTENIENNKRIAKNAVFLYLRMFFVMVISLYTSRVILQKLGIEDFGIYNVIGGVVSMMGFINVSMSSSTTRYMNFAIGKKDINLANKTFSSCLIIYIALSLLLLLLGETIGLWFVNNKLTIPDDRIYAANWVYQFSLLSCIATVISNPYHATIIAHEKMNVYAFISIVEVLLKLLIVLLLSSISYDKLYSYGLLFMIQSCIVTLIYYLYCKKNYVENKFRFFDDKTFFKELIAYSGWNIFGSVASLVKSQGLNILLNMFFNPVVNAARGIAYQVNAAILQFFSSFYTAVRPQITKYYASGDIDNMRRLVFSSSRYSFFLILLLALPITIEAPFIIELWLGQIPEYTIPFLRLIIVISAIDSMSSPIMTAAHSTGKIALYQACVGTLSMLNIPISFCVLKIIHEPLIVFQVSLLISIISAFVRLWIVSKQIKISVKLYIADVYVRCAIVAILASVIPILLNNYLEGSVVNNILICVICVISALLFIIFIGMKSSERATVFNVVSKKIKNGYNV